ncbi:hypothetical protein J2Z49_002261 [Desulfofundulus luciae]|uniref:CARD domain-containing protein n=2 Tax=Desulfofundulus luciae TaxID=74702 RepID=A0ABU0B344_9FIRM|nr:hypothetical protein [Desulfofundulus luciae]
MLLAYEYEGLLINLAHRNEVVSILQALDETDLVTPEIAKRKEAMIERLRRLGEHKIYERLRGSIPTA